MYDFYGSECSSPHRTSNKLKGRGIELGFRGKRKGETNIFKGGDTDGTDKTDGIIATAASSFPVLTTFPS